MKIRIFLLLVTIWTLTGCKAADTPEPTITPVIILPTFYPNTIPTPTSAPTLTSLCPNPDCIFITPSAGTPEPLRFNLPTPGAEPISIWRPPQYPVPLALSPYDHFYFARPIGADEINWPVADYRYGGIFLSKEVTHTGVDIPAKAGTPVIAAGTGTVVWAGWGLFSGIPDNIQDPYGMAVAIRHDFGYQGQPLFTIYAHMRMVDVAVGQWVETGVQLGEVGDTGYTTGPHLHFEVRIGENTYYYTRNPELWIAPPQGWGVLAGRITGSNRKTINSFQVFIRSVETNREWMVYTYGPEAVNPDAYYNENMAISDLPAGRYTVRVVLNGKTYKVELEISPGRVTYFSFGGNNKFSSEPPPAPSIETSTPIW